MIATFEVEINGRTRRVAVERIGPAAEGRYRITIEGRSRLVDARPAGPGRLSLLFPDEEARSYDVAVAQASVTDLHIHLPEGAVTAIVNGRRSRREGPSERAGDGEQRIAAPMPGRIVKVLVAPGDDVKARQPLVVVEAMKMENELSAPRGGRVKDVQVRDGMSVEAGRLLVVVE
ncbi:MAG TPA: biotin/lipoyl-containing protein [Vicinamibacterales bacterium]|nr:biotin/lipoyl-containing protein [Vicinamibacterales bacterium]